ncbi:MBOAT family protein [bacterium]|nr:MBOAT family protein [bacterium]
MLFNSLHYLLFFLVTTPLYYFLGDRNRLVLLLVAGCYFYMAFIPAYVLVLFAVILLDYGAAHWIATARGPRRRLFLLLSLIANVGLLAAFKYYNFAAENLRYLCNLNLPPMDLPLPIGLSFHTFQSMAYTIEVFRGSFQPERNLLRYSVYVMFYPQLVAGPIERPAGLLPQLAASHAMQPDRIAGGLKLMLWGLFKKVVIADRLAVYVNQVYADPAQYSGPPLMIATFFFAFQIYCDFSGYSDIGIGAARVLGYDLMTNFRRPYLAVSVADFWRRWHISLSTWFRDYLYFPLAGARGGSARTYRNLLITFVVSGLWHGANWTFVIWGALHGTYLILARFGRFVNSRWLGRLVTFCLVLVAWVFFRASSLAQACYVLANWWPGQGGGLLTLGRPLDFWLSLLLIVGLLITDVLGEKRDENFMEWLARRPVGERWTLYYLLLFGIAFLGKFASEQFIYFQF